MSAPSTVPGRIPFLPAQARVRFPPLRGSRPLNPRLRTLSRGAALSREENSLLAVSVLAVLGRSGALGSALARAARAGVSPRLLRETLLQVHLFAGFPRAIEAFERLGEVAGRVEPAPSEGKDGRRAAGLALFERIYAAQAPGVRRRLADLHPALERWVMGHAYGRVLARPALSPRLRELLAVASLVALRCWKPLASHLRGAVRCGASPGEVRAAIEVASAHVPRSSAIRARRMLALLAGGSR
ncbi:MAG: carboxymuconolactone decarboxylase family protein [Planctomycetota bacterium]